MPDRRLRRSAARLLLVAAGAVLLYASPAQAHKLSLFAEARGSSITGLAYFAGGGRVRNAELTVLGPNGKALGRTRTNDKGEFVFHAKVRCDHTFVLEPGDGHRATCTVTAEELPEDLPSPDGTPAAATSRPAASPGAVASGPATPASRPSAQRLRRSDVQKLVALAVRKEFERHREEVRIRDIIAGVGYIFGVMGLLLYFKRRRRPAGKT